MIVNSSVFKEFNNQIARKYVSEISVFKQNYFRNIILDEQSYWSFTKRVYISTGKRRYIKYKDHVIWVKNYSYKFFIQTNSNLLVVRRVSILI